MYIETLESKTIEHAKFGIELYLMSGGYGWTQLNDKWVLDNDGPIVGSGGRKWDCTWYKIGVLKKGADVTTYRAQKEFDRDCSAFDVNLKIVITKNNIELLDNYIISSDYSYDDDQTLEQLMNYLISDYLDLDEHIERAENILKELLN